MKDLLLWALVLSWTATASAGEIQGHIRNAQGRTFAEPYTVKTTFMEKNSRSASGRGGAWHHAAIVPPALRMLANGGPAGSESADAAFDWARTYAGVFAGYSRVDNRIVDVDGFANWGNRGWAVDYGDSGFVVGALVGKKLDIGGVPLRMEFDGMSGRMSARSNRLDPEGLDETAKSEFRWIATARAGVEQPLGPVTVFASGGLAAARIDNSVTDIDFGPNMPTRVDPDDSFHDGSAEIGWVIGLGVEVPLADAWILRLDGSYLNFGRSTHYVNRSGNGRCGPGSPRRPCPYNVENNLGIVRLAIIHRFGR